MARGIANLLKKNEELQELQTKIESLEKLLEEKENLIETIKAVNAYFKELEALYKSLYKSDQQKLVDKAWRDYTEKLEKVKDLL